MNTIHKQAVIGNDVTIGKGNIIGPHVVIEDGVAIGSKNNIGPGTVIYKGSTIGDGNDIHAGVIIGDTPQDVAFNNVQSSVRIGNNNKVREYVTIHRGTKARTATVIGNDNFLMGYTHVAHNCQIGNGVVTVNTVVLGGYVVIEDCAFISASVVIHQFCRIGTCAMISGLTAVNQDVPPYVICGGRPALVHALNSVGLKRGGFKPEERSEIKQAFKMLYYSGMNVPNALEAIKKECTTNAAVSFVRFIEQSKRGIASAAREDEYRF